MCTASKFLRNNKGMTLVEVMMAIAVFGIILVFITQMTAASSRITDDNLDQVMMSELALAEIEKIKAGEPYPADLNRTINYPPGVTGGEVQRTYAIKYYPKDTDGIFKVVLGPVGSTNSDNPLKEDNPDNYVLVTWLP